MNKKYTFTELCDTYNKIEIPIIQRDYAQGRNTPDVQRIREKFINDYLIPAVVAGEQIELDFVYGTVHTEVKEELKLKTFIPLDGQQRLTTLFLFHIFIALKENKLEDIIPTLSKFTYETRPSAHDFCRGLLTKLGYIDDISKLRFQIEDAVWFNEEWLHDPTVTGMLNVLNDFASNELLLNYNDSLLAKLLDNEVKLISFYFTDLDQFGLTESLYIRMNARGKMLTDFENFKSEFFKIIRYSPVLLENVKTKIEYDWVENFWEYRKDGLFVIDDPFMRYLRFITEMLYYKSAPFRASVTSYESDFLNFRVLNEIYLIEENLRFLIFALDHVKYLKQKNFGVLWVNEGLVPLSNILNEIINGSNDIDRSIILFSALKYNFAKKPEQNLEDYVRVVRNLIYNTEDNSRREWPRLISSIENLITDDNVYQILANFEDENSLIGFNVNQRKEEVYKAKLIIEFPQAKAQLVQIENHPNFKGNITNLLIIPFVETEQEFTKVALEKLPFDQSRLSSLQEIFRDYEMISKNDFNPIWGNLLVTGLYEQTYESRLIYSANFRKHPAILIFAKKFNQSKKSLSDFIVTIQKKFINDLTSAYSDFSTIRNVKHQLYIYYIIDEQIYKKQFDGFFKNYNFNFGWLAKGIGYKTHYTQGIEGCKYFPNTNPIFQLYNSQFRYNSGLNTLNTLDLEIVGGGKKREPFKAIQEWASV